MPQLEESSAAFETTRWSLVDALRRPERRAAALELLCRAYWPPVYAYLRRRGHARDEAAETTQAFFADIAAGRDLFARAEAGRGRLRTLIVTALKRFLIDRHRRDGARPSGHSVPLEHLEREEAMLPEFAGLDPEETLERRWALAILHEAIARARTHFVAKPGHWCAFESRVLSPAVANTRPIPLDEVARRCGFRLPGDAASAVQVVSKRVRALLVEVVAELSPDPRDRDEDLRRVIDLLG